jgi:hypothetical protein
MQCKSLTRTPLRAVYRAPVRLGRTGPVRVRYALFTLKASFLHASICAYRAPGLLGCRCDDDEMIPLSKVKTGFTAQELEQMAHPKLLGGKTVGEELGRRRPPAAPGAC